MLLAVAGGPLIDGTGREPAPRGAVVVEDGRIAAAGPEERVRMPRGAKVLDAAGRTILPGFIDCHVHSVFRHRDLRRHLQNPPTYNLFRSLEILRQTIDAGVTTARDMGGADPGMRQAIEEGLIAGPRLLVSIVMISQTGGHGDTWVPAGVRVPKRPWLTDGIADGVDEMRRLVRQLLRDGADFIKVCATGGITSVSDHYDQAQFSVEEIAVAVREAAARGRRVAAHAEGLAGIRNALRAGVHSVEHGWFLDEECIEEMVRQGTWWVPTLALVPMSHERRLADPAWGAQGLTSEEARKDEETFARLQAQRPLFREAVRRGVRFAMGTDQSHRLMIGLAELAHMVDYMGISPMEAIVAATGRAAECLERADLGTLEPGKRADVVVADGDPLADVRLLADPGRLHLILKDGAVHRDRMAGG
jgi:imidazolonepropionase-like amidohydrolase